MQRLPREVDTSKCTQNAGTRPTHPWDGKNRVCKDCEQHLTDVGWITPVTPTKTSFKFPGAIYYMNHLGNPRFTEKTFTNLEKSHRLPHVCTIMIYGKLGVSLAGNCYIYIYTYIIHRNQCPIWVSLMWVLEKHNDITLKRGVANLERSHRLPCVFNNFHQLPFP